MRGGAGNDLLRGFGGGDIADFTDKTMLVVADLTFPTRSVSVFVGGVLEDTLEGIEWLMGGSAADTLTGNHLQNVFFGDAGNDVLRGGDGSDTLNGGAGIDTADFRNEVTSVTVTLAGEQRVAATILDRGAGAGQAETLQSIEVVYGGSAADSLTGDGLANLFRGGGGNDVLVGGDGRDSVDYRDKTASVILYLNGTKEAVATVGGVAEDTVSGFENVYGGSGADTFRGDAAANQLFGNGGNDVLRGLGGADTLTGGAGRDAFVYNTVAESTVAPSGRDIIVDFDGAAGDRIVLRDIDADGTTAGDQAFVVGALLAGSPGRLAVTRDGGAWLVQGDVNGDGAAEFAILVQSDRALTATDFVL